MTRTSGANVVDGKGNDNAYKIELPEEGEDDEDLPSSSHSSTMAIALNDQDNIPNANKGPITPACAREIQNKVNLFLSNVHIFDEDSILPNACTFLVLRFEGLVSLEVKTKEQNKRLAEMKLCLTAQVFDNGIMREEREDGSTTRGKVQRAWETSYCGPACIQAEPIMKTNDRRGLIRSGGLDPPDRHRVKIV
uniref:Uncharacterized protein n=1 Tax=Setaria italica TaxID=4555 RepID=K4AIW3_SETIT